MFIAEGTKLKDLTLSQTVLDDFYSRAYDLESLLEEKEAIFAPNPLISSR